jgi:hypothetical protein
MLQRPRDCHHCVGQSCPHRCWLILNERRNAPPASAIRIEPKTPPRPRCFMQIRTAEQSSRLL